MTRSIVSLCVAALLALPAPAQDSAAASLSARVQSSSVELAHYTPQLFSVEELLNTANQLFGETVQIALPDKRGNYTDDSDVNDMSHFIVLGSTLLIRDSKARAASIVQMLRELEESEQVTRAKNGTAPGGPESSVIPRDKLQVEQLRVRYLTFDALNTVLANFTRNIEVPNTSGGTDTIQNFTSVPEAGFVLARDTAERIAEVRKLIDQIDRPVPTVQVSALILRLSPDKPANDKELPAELASGLRAIVPVGGIETIGVAVVRSAIQPGRSCSIQNESEDGCSWSLEFSPDSFDPDGGQVGLSNCSFHITVQQGSRPPSTQQFQTNLSVKLGEYTILGAVGAKPVFVALRIDPVRGRAN